MDDLKKRRVLVVPDDSPWMTPAEAAAYAHVSEKRMKKWIREGYIPRVRITEGTNARGRQETLLERSDIDNFLRAQKEHKRADALGDAVGAEAAKPRRRLAPVSTGKNAFRERLDRAVKGSSAE